MHDHRYHALIKLLAELIKEYHEKLANEHSVQIGGNSGQDRVQDDRPARLAE